MNPERKNVIEYDGNMILCQHCINHPKCIIMKENNNFKWATELACPICKKSFFICGLCLPSTGYKMTQLGKKRLKKHSVGKNHQQLLENKNEKMVNVGEHSYAPNIVMEEDNIVFPNEVGIVDQVI